MIQRTDYRFIPPVDPEADKACRLTTEMSSRRAESTEDFFAAADDQTVLPNGYELRFAGEEGTASRIEAFIAAEQECCPFFAFETWREGGLHVIRILRLDVGGEMTAALPGKPTGAERWRTGFKPGEGDAD